MKKCKYRMKFLLAVTLLIIIPLVPLTVSKIQNNQLIGHLQVEKIKNDRLDFNENYVCYNYTVKRYSNVLDS